MGERNQVAAWDFVDGLAEPLVCHACLKGAVVNEQRAFDELATIIAGENAFARENRNTEPEIVGGI
jgi:hypothetical protein